MLARLLIILAFTFFVCSTNAQTYTIINSPSPVTYSAYSSAAGPNGGTMSPTFYGVFWVDWADLAIPSASIDISSFGFAFTNSLLTNPASGTLEVYLSNTTDMSYNKGDIWSTAIAGMTQVYNGIFNIPTGTVETNVDLNLPVHFNYGGAGLYVAYSYTETVADNSPNAEAWYKCTYMPPLPTVSLGVVAPTSTTNMQYSIPRPVFRFGLAHPLTTVDEYDLDNTFTLYPNPCSDHIKLVNGLNNMNMQVRVLDTKGQEIKKMTLYANEYDLELKDIAPGIYFLELSSQGKKNRKKFIIE